MLRPVPLDVCAVPLIVGSTNGKGGYKNCAAADPPLNSQAGESFIQWWTGPALTEFRQQFGKGSLPQDCHRCVTQEKLQEHSFRMAVNKTVDWNNINTTIPSRWKVSFGNICNLSCWMCSEQYSSTIEQHMKILQLLPDNYVSTQTTFDAQWIDLQQQILNSYQHHRTITITIAGGEPLYNRTVLDFLKNLIKLGLASRTKLEFHTNATKFNKEISNLVSSKVWKYVCIFLSIDAVGKLAEWIRYGCNWARIKNNIQIFQQSANYVEVHSVLTVLNVGDLVNIKMFCQEHNLPLKIIPLASPEFMSLKKWSGPPNRLCDKAQLEQHGLTEYYELIGQDADITSVERLRKHITSFDPVRKNLRKFSPSLADALML